MSTPETTNTTKPNEILPTGPPADLDVKLTIKQLDIMAHWDFKATDITENKCTLCRRELMAPTREDMDKGRLRCEISLGKCAHAFHTDCIQSYIKKNASCPIDRTPWNLDRVLDSNYTWKKITRDKKKPVATNKLYNAPLPPAPAGTYAGAPPGPLYPAGFSKQVQPILQQLPNLAPAPKPAKQGKYAPLGGISTKKAVPLPPNNSNIVNKFLQNLNNKKPAI
ncbi:MAG: RING-H2 zinc finger [Edafosvirus sp.]|uniref:RING-H2 zinc finger n=1 Tax=Edafosvirus sp. TaxID=2487765 RepID=A0A3G4ZV58_9VIRU|nr:MAG: RING-H2 zinc finger [Edafosvirus sp.]